MKRLFLLFTAAALPFLFFSFLVTHDRSTPNSLTVLYERDLPEKDVLAYHFSNMLRVRGYEVREGTFAQGEIDSFLISNPSALFLTQQRLAISLFTLHEYDCLLVKVAVAHPRNPLSGITEAEFSALLERDMLGSRAVAEKVERGRLPVGVISYSDLSLKMKPLSVDGVFPSLVAIKNGSYRGALRVYVYTGEKNSVLDDESITYECGLWLKKSFSLIAGGDIMLSRGTERYIETYGPIYPFIRIAEEIRKHDIAFANLESPISKRGSRFLPDKGIYFRADPSVAEGLKYSGFNVFSLANNHSLDWGVDGITDTIDILEENGLRYTGIGRNRQEAFRPVTFSMSGTRVAIISFNDIYPFKITESSGRTMTTLTLDSPDLKAEIARLKNNCDILIASLHTGIEYVRQPEPEKVEKMKRLIEYGVDIVIGSHPHVVQDVKIYNGGLIAYSLGNLIFDQSWSNETSVGLLLEVAFIGKKPIYYRLHLVSIKDAQARLGSIEPSLGRASFLTREKRSYEYVKN